MLSRAQRTKSTQGTLPQSDQLITRALHWRRLAREYPRKYEATQAARPFATKDAVIDGLKELLDGALPPLPKAATRSLAALKEVYISTYVTYTTFEEHHSASGVRGGRAKRTSRLVRGNFEKALNLFAAHASESEAEMQVLRIALEMQVLRVALCSPMPIRPSHDGA